MPTHLILLVLSFVLLLVAAVLEFPRNPASPGYGHFLGWLGLACFVLTGVVP